MTDWITKTFESLGYWGVALAMFLENVFPPIPSEAVLPAAGIAARQGALSVWGVILAANLGSLVGVSLWYFVGRRIGFERLCGWADRWGRYVGLRSKDMRRADEWFDRYGHWAVFVGRMIPGIRSLVSVPAGFSGMSFGRFLLYSAAGTAVWTAVLVFVGWSLGRNAEVVERVISWVGTAVIVGLVLWAAHRAWKAWRHGHADEAEARRGAVEQPAGGEREPEGARRNLPGRPLGRPAYKPPAYRPSAFRRGPREAH